MIPSPLASSCVEPCGYVAYVLCCVFSIIYILNVASVQVIMEILCLPTYGNVYVVNIHWYSPECNWFG